MVHLEYLLKTLYEECCRHESRFYGSIALFMFVTSIYGVGVDISIATDFIKSFTPMLFLL